jgi:hypothetical protein
MSVVYSILEATFGENHVALAPSLLGIGACHLGRNAAEKALIPLERALRLQESADDTPPSDLAQTQFFLARALMAAGRDQDRSITLARLALDVQHRNLPGTTPARQHEIATWLAHHTE